MDERIKNILAEALQTTNPEERRRWLERACAGDEALRKEVESLLKAYDQAGDFFDHTVRLPVSDPGEPEGARIGRYKLLEKIGEGGFGSVWMAEQEEPVRRRVALKIIKLGMDTREVVARFEAERQALAMMDHPNIASVFDGGATEKGRPYFVMELVKGVPITDYCDMNKLSTRERLDLFMQVCQAVQHAHQKGLIHRDLKPSNILVTVKDDRPVPKVIDFGIAKATQARLTEKTLFTRFQQWMGTPAYMSPEQAGLGSLDVDTRSDIYSLGVLLYELLTGRTPFDTQKLLEAGYDAVMRTIREEEPAKPSTRLSTLAKEDLSTVAAQRGADPAKLNRLVRGDLDWIVMKALEKDRSRRYGTATDLAHDIERHLVNEPIMAGPPGRLYRLNKMVSRNRVAFATGTAIGLALVLGAGLASWQAILARGHRLRAESEAQRANLNEDKERVQRKRAETAAAEARAALSEAHFLQACRFVAEDKDHEAVAYLVASLRADPANDAAATRLATLLAGRPWSRPLLDLQHGGEVYCARFSPDGQRIATASQDGTARLWEARTGEPLTSPMQHTNRVNSVQFSRDGNWVLTASGLRWPRVSGGRPPLEPQGEAGVWDVRTGKPLFEPIRFSGALNCAAFSPDGKRFVTASADSSARVWDAQTGEPLTDPLPHAEEVCDAQFSPDGTRIATGSHDGTARVWDARTGQPLTAPLKHSWIVLSVQFGPDSKRVATTCADGTTRVWDAQTGQPLTSLPQQSGWVFSSQFSPDGKRLVTGGTTRVWDAQTGRALAGPLQHPAEVLSARFSPDGKRVVTASLDHSARVWNAQTGERLSEPLQHANWVTYAEFNPDGQRIVTASYDGVARVWQAQTGVPDTAPLRHSGAVHSAEFSPDGRWVVTASADNTARVWDTGTGLPISGPLNHSGEVCSAEFSPDGRLVVTASADGSARIWGAQTGQPEGEPLRHSAEVNSAHFSPNGERIVTGSTDGTVRIWEVRTGKEIMEPLQHSSWVIFAQYSPDGARLVTASGDFTARVWDANTGQQLSPPLEHGSWVLSADFSSDGKKLLTASRDCTTRLWDAQTGQPLMKPRRLASSINSARLSPDGSRFVTASHDNTARVWDIKTGQPLTEPMQHAAEVRSAQFSPDGKRIVTASHDFAARVWDAQTGQPLTEPFQHAFWVTSARFSPDGKQIVTASLDRTARVWDVAPSSGRYPDWLLELGAAVCGQVLSPRVVLESREQIKALDQLKRQLSEAAGGDPWLVFGRWVLADPSTRTISPFSRITAPEWIGRRLKENNHESLSELERWGIATGDAGLLERVAQARRALPGREMILEALKGFAYDRTQVTTLDEAGRMLKAISPAAELHSFADDVTCGLLDTGYHVSIWINSFNKTNTYGIRYGTESDHSYINKNNTYFEIVKPVPE